MSFRKPRSIIIRHDNEESSGEEMVEKAPVKGGFVGARLRLTTNRKVTDRKSKKLRKKVKIKQGIDNEDEPLSDIEFHLKPNKRGITLPLFNKLEDDVKYCAVDGIDELRKQVDSQRAPSEEIISIMHDTERDEYIPSKEKYISVMSPEEGSNEETGSETNVLDDERLPLTEKEAMMQKKLHDLKIKDTLYDAELSQGEDLDDWESSKIRHGAMMGSKTTTIQDRFPKMNLLGNETFEDQLKALDESITVLKSQQLQRSTEIGRLKEQRKKYENELAQLNAEVSNLS